MAVEGLNTSRKNRVSSFKRYPLFIRRKTLGDTETASNKSKFRSTSRRSSSWTPFENIWGHIQRRHSSKVEDKNTDFNDSTNCLSEFQDDCKHGWQQFKHRCRLGFRQRSIALSVFLTFAVICSTGLSVIFKLASDIHASLEHNGLMKAEEMAYRIESELCKTRSPLFSTMVMYTMQIDIRMNQDKSFNLGQFCNTEKAKAKFRAFASGLKNHSGLPAGMIHLQMSFLSGTVCVDNHYVDLNPKTLLNLQQLSNTNNRAHEINSHEKIDTKIYGPFLLNASYDRTFVVQYPFCLEKLKNGTQIPICVSATLSVDWNEIEKELDMINFFENLNVDYKLDRPNYSPSLDSTTNERVVFSQSRNAESINDSNSRLIELKQFGSGWALTIGNCSHRGGVWIILSSIGVTLLSIGLALGTLAVLVSKKEHEKHLYRLMPKNVISRLQKGETVIERYPNATICFLDLVSFTTISQELSACEVMEMLKSLYTLFDQLAEKHQVFNVETIGDAYIVLAGGPDGYNAIDGAQRVASFALDVVAATKIFSFQGFRWNISVRAGLASGLVIAGVIGTELVPKFTLFGQTFDMADYLESGSMSNQVLCSRETYRLLLESQTHSFCLQLRCNDNTKLIHEQINDTYWINGVTKKEKQKTLSPNISNLNLSLVNELEIADNSKFTNGIIYVVDDYDINDAQTRSKTEIETHFQYEDESVHCSNDKPAGNQKIKDEITCVKEDYDTNHSQTSRENEIETRFQYDESSNCSDDKCSVEDDELIAKMVENMKCLVSNPRKRRTSQSSLDQNIFSQMRRRGSISNLLTSMTKDEETTSLDNENSLFHSREKEQDDYSGDDSISSDRSGFNDYWSSIAKNSDKWQTGEEMKEETKFSYETFSQIFYQLIFNFFRYIQRALHVARTDKSIPIATFLTFALLFAAGITSIMLLAKEQEGDSRELAIDQGQKVNRWFSIEFQKLNVPLFTLGATSTEFIPFQRLPSQIENRTVSFNEKDFAFRNVSEICDVESSLKLFNHLTSIIKDNAGLEKVLVSLQLAPHGVLCMAYPLLNTEDFEEGIYLDNSGAIGLDMLKDPRRSTFSKQSIKAREVSINGPVSLLEGNQSKIEEVIIGRYPIFTPNHKIEIDNKTYDFWGFSVALMNWEKFKLKIRLNEFLGRNGWDFKMIDTETIFNETTNAKHQHVKILAESDNAHILDESNSEIIALNCSENNWSLIVGRSSNFQPTWKVWGSALVLVLSFILSLLLFIILASSRQHALLLYRMMPRNVIRRLRRGETVVDRDNLGTVFFSNINGFSTLSGEMKPAEFMIMLNQIYGEFDKLTIKHGVSKVESIGAHYIVTASGPKRSTNPVEGVVRVALFALDAMKFAKKFKYKGISLYIQAGIASGPIVSGVIGAAVPKYTIFGDTVNYCSRMESTSKPMKIQISSKTNKLLGDNQSGFNFKTSERREKGKKGIMVKGKGHRYTFWLEEAHCSKCDNNSCSMHDKSEFTRENEIDPESKDEEML